MGHNCGLKIKALGKIMFQFSNKEALYQCVYETGAPQEAGGTGHLLPGGCHPRHPRPGRCHRGPHHDGHQPGTQEDRKVLIKKQHVRKM